MFKKKAKDYYSMNEKQFEQMKQFYYKLGYSKNNVERLCRNCFGADIRIRDISYSENWTFWRTRSYNEPSVLFAGLSRRGNVSGMPLVEGIPTEFTELCEDGAVSIPAANMSMGMTAPGSVPAPMIAATELPEFNTAETHNVNELEPHSPLDAPQAIFSANVNTASWTYLRGKIKRRRPIDTSFVRIEEIINSYKYKLAPPADDALFAISAETAPCPWNDDAELLFVGMKGKKNTERVFQNLTFLVDVSGSMEDEWILTQMALASIVSKLQAGDKMSVIAYSDKTTTVVKQMDCGSIDKCVDAILKIDGIGGCTNGSDGLENAYSYLSETFTENGNNRVFIFTDGDFNFGVTSEGELKDFIYRKRETGIYLSIVGFGEQNFKDNKMETLAQNGNGNYTFVGAPCDIIDNLWDKLISNLVTVAKDVKISIEMNPEYVSDYRLIGYDARTLTQKEFHDTSKATDGIGSEHNVAALIEFKRGEAKQRYSTRYVNTSVQSNHGELAFVEIHYKSPDDEDLVMTHVIKADEIKNNPRINISSAAALAAFGLVVKNSNYKGKADRSLVRSLLKDLEVGDQDSHRAIIEDYCNQ